MFPTAHTMIDAILIEHFSAEERRQRRPFYSGLINGEPTSPSPSPDDFNWLRTLGRRASAAAAASLAVIASI